MKLIRPKSLKELALEHLRGRIVDGTLKMGQALSERGISDELGVSKSPVREAFAQLRDEGLVTIEPQKGARVFTLTELEVNQICDFREAIEAAAFEIALKRNQKKLAKEMGQIVKEMGAARKSGDDTKYLALDSAFHQAIFQNCENDYLSASYNRYAGKIAALRTHLSVLPQHTKLSYDEHVGFAEAAQSGDMSEIRRLMAIHMDRTRTTYSASANPP